MKMQIALAVAAAFALSACEHYRAPANLAHVKPGIYINPQGCDSWYFEGTGTGFMSPRLDRNGKPVCSGVKVPPPTS